MEGKDAIKAIPLSHHSDFILWVANRVGGIINHDPVPSFKYLNLVPDIYVERDGKIGEIHEVETLWINGKKIERYSRRDGYGRLRRPKSVLWVCLNPLGMAFDEVRVICQFDISGKVDIKKPVPKISQKVNVMVRCDYCDAIFQSIDEWEKHVIENHLKKEVA